MAPDREANKKARREATSAETLDRKMWDAVERDDLVAAKEVYMQGACANLWYDLFDGTTCSDNITVIPYENVNAGYGFDNEDVSI